MFNPDAFDNSLCSMADHKLFVASNSPHLGLFQSLQSDE